MEDTKYFEYLFLSDQTAYLHAISYDKKIKFDEIRAVREKYKDSNFDFYFTGKLYKENHILIKIEPFKSTSEYNQRLIIPSYAILDGKKYAIALGMESILSLDKISIVFIPKDISTIIANPFYKPNIKYIECDAQNKFFKSIDGILYSKNLTKLIACPQILSDNAVLPSSVKIIGDQAYHETLQSKLIIPSSIEKIEGYSLNSSNLKVIFVPSSVKHIDNFAFGDWGVNNFRTIYVCSNTKTEEYTFCKGFIRPPKERIIYYTPENENKTLNKVLNKSTNQIHIDWYNIWDKCGTIAKTLYRLFNLLLNLYTGFRR